MGPYLKSYVDPMGIIASKKWVVEDRAWESAQKIRATFVEGGAL